MRFFEGMLRLVLSVPVLPIGRPSNSMLVNRLDPNRRLVSLNDVALNASDAVVSFMYRVPRGGALMRDARNSYRGTIYLPRTTNSGHATRREGENPFF
jgi:hypothetical protein